MYDLTQRLLSQEQLVFARQHAFGCNMNGIVTLTIREPLPAMKQLTETVEEHWKAMLHAAISEATQPSEMLPFFERAFAASHRDRHLQGER